MKKIVYYTDPIKFLEWYIKNKTSGITFEDALQRYNSNPEFKNRVYELMQEENTRRKESRAKRGSEFGSKFGPITGKKNAKTGHIQNIQKVGAALGGKANTESQKIAREKQNKEHFAPAGTAAAASQKIELYNEYHEKFYKLMPNNTWFSLIDAQKLADNQFDDSILVQKFKRKFKVRNHMTKFTNVWYEVKKGKSLLYRKIETLS